MTYLLINGVDFCYVYRKLKIEIFHKNGKKNLSNMSAKMNAMSTIDTLFITIGPGWLNELGSWIT